MTAPLPPALAACPTLGAWLDLSERGVVAVRAGKVELGQGIRTALAQIVADGLAVDPACVRVLPASTAAGPDGGYTAGSLSIQHAGRALAAVSAEARELLRGAAAARLGVAAGDLACADGTARDGAGRAVTWWDLDAAALLDRPATGAAPPAGPPRWVGRSLPRPDLAAKVAGEAAFLQDQRPPGLLHGRVLRPPAPGRRLVGIDPGAARDLPGVVEVVVDGSFVGVVARRGSQADAAVERLRRSATWDAGSPLPEVGALAELPVSTDVLHVHGGDAGTQVDGEVRTRRFSRPYLLHASIGTSCATARWEDGHLDVVSHTQGVHPLRRALAAALAVEEGCVQVTHGDGAGCYGHTGADDAALDAALLARAVPGRPVRVRWSRADELAWSPLAPAMEVEVRVEVDGGGWPRRWVQEIWSSGHSSRPSSPGLPPLLAETEVAGGRAVGPAGDPAMASGGGAGRNAVPGYRIPEVRVVRHLVDVSPLRTSAMRALGAHLNVYAIESVVDELADAAGTDRVAYRAALLDDPRARAVLAAAAGAGGWGSPLPAGATGRGVGVARYKGTGAWCAVVAEVEAERAVRVRRLWVAADIGTPINPVGARAQLEGAAVQATSWTVLEGVWPGTADLPSSWDGYPILGFEDAPDVEVQLVGGGEPLGAGEAAVGPTAAAIGSAVSASIGVAARELPLRPSHLLAAVTA